MTEAEKQTGMLGPPDHRPAAREVDGRLAAGPPGAGDRRSRCASLRREQGLTLAEMAARTGHLRPMLSKIENASISCSLTTLDRLAEVSTCPSPSLFRGADTQREAVYTPAGAGARIVQRGTRVGHDYTLLGALRGPHKRMEAHIVTLTERSEEFPVVPAPRHGAALHARRRNGLRPRRRQLPHAPRRRAPARRRRRPRPARTRRTAHPLPVSLAYGEVGPDFP